MTDKKVVHINTRRYWGVFDNKDGLLLEGTFNECWNYLVTTYERYTVAMLVRDGIRIKRVK